MPLRKVDIICNRFVTHFSLPKGILGKASRPWSRFKEGAFP